MVKSLGFLLILNKDIAVFWSFATTPSFSYFIYTSGITDAYPRHPPSSVRTIRGEWSEVLSATAESSTAKLQSCTRGSSVTKK